MSSLKSNAERLIQDIEPIETTSPEEWCENVYERSRNLEHWKLFSSGDKNYALYRAVVVKSEADRTWATEVAKATELSLTKAQRIGASLVIPGVSIDYINGGYGGYTAWVIETDERKSLEDIFWLPGSRNTGNGHVVVGDDGEQVAMRSLGGMSSKQIENLTDRLAGVNLTDYLGLDAAVA